MATKKKKVVKKKKAIDEPSDKSIVALCIDLGNLADFTDEDGNDIFTEPEDNTREQNIKEIKIAFQDMGKDDSVSNRSVKTLKALGLDVSRLPDSVKENTMTAENTEKEKKPAKKKAAGKKKPEPKKKPVKKDKPTKKKAAPKKTKEKKAPAKKKGAPKNGQKSFSKFDATALIGQTLEKEFKGKKIKVKVTEKGFVYNKKTYASLTKLANEIAAYSSKGRVSGPKFFGLS